MSTPRPLKSSTDVLQLLPCEGGAYVKPGRRTTEPDRLRQRGRTHLHQSLWLRLDVPEPTVQQCRQLVRKFHDAESVFGHRDGQYRFHGRTDSLNVVAEMLVASTSPGQMALDTLRVDQSGVNAPTRSHG